MKSGGKVTNHSINIIFNLKFYAAQPREGVIGGTVGSPIMTPL